VCADGGPIRWEAISPRPGSDKRCLSASRAHALCECVKVAADIFDNAFLAAAEEARRATPTARLRRGLNGLSAKRMFGLILTAVWTRLVVAPPI